MCKFESLQKDESRAQSPDPSKYYRKPRAFIWLLFNLQTRFSPQQNKQLVIINGVRYNLKLMTEISDLKPRKIINLVLLCFAIDDLSSCQKLTQLLRNVAKQLRIKTTHIPRWVVALKEDLRGHQDAHDRIIPEDREKTIVSQLSAQKFFRCSARTGQGVKELFAEALKFYKEQNESK